MEKYRNDFRLASRSISFWILSWVSFLGAVVVSPFSATIDGNKLYGRGTEDMKSSIACFLSATHEFIEKNGKNFDGKISFIITGDEEKEAINGTAKIMEWTKKQNII